MRFCYPGGGDLLPLLEKAILALSPQTKWYGPVLNLEDYRDVPLPRLWRDRSAWAKTMLSGAAPADQLDEGVDDVIDEEEDFYAEVRAEFDDSTAGIDQQEVGHVTCYIWGQQCHEIDTIFCITPEHEDRKMHCRCAGFDGMPDPALWRCPECQQSLNRPPSPGHEQNETIFCFICSQPCDEFSTIFCITDGHDGRKMHYRCAGFETMPDSSAWKCPPCQTRSRRSHRKSKRRH